MTVVAHAVINKNTFAVFEEGRGLKTVFVGGTAKGREIPNDRG